MTKLFSADRLRLRKTWFFWLLLVVAVLLTIPAFREEWTKAGYYADTSAGWVIDEAFFQFAMVHGIMLSAFVPLFLGADYSDGTIRNKLIAGHRRGAVYLSALFTCMLTALCLLMTSMAANAILAFLTNGHPGMDGRAFALYMLSAFCCILAFVSLYVMCSMLIPNRSYAIVVCIVVLIAMLFLARELDHALSEAEIARDVIGFVDGEPVWSEPYLNPNYISGWKRTVMEFAYDLLPTGQGSQLSNMGADHIRRYPLMSGIFILVTSNLGLLAFHKKDIK